MDKETNKRITDIEYYLTKLMLENRDLDRRVEMLEEKKDE